MILKMKSRLERNRGLVNQFPFFFVNFDSPLSIYDAIAVRGRRSVSSHNQINSDVPHSRTTKRARRARECSGDEFATIFFGGGVHKKDQSFAKGCVRSSVTCPCAVSLCCVNVCPPIVKAKPSFYCVTPSHQDGVDLPPPVDFDLEENSHKLPQSHGSFMCSVEGRSFSRQFLEQYFNLYDNQISRDGVAEAYAENAHFSMTAFSGVSG